MASKRRPQPETEALAEAVLERLLSQYSAVEARSDKVAEWIARKAEPPPRRRYFRLSAPAWAVVAVALLLILGLSWHRSRLRAADTRARLAAGEKTVLVPLNPAPPLTERQKQLIQLLQTNPTALANQPAAAPPPIKHE